MAGCDYQEARRHPRCSKLLSSPEAESAFVVSVSDTLRDLLASVTPDDLAHAAVPWAATYELQLNGVDADEAVSSLEILAGLARRAREAGLRLYCWWAL
jgi:hypothetical protein